MFLFAGFQARIILLPRNTSMSRALKTLRLAQWSMLASILLYVGLGEVVRPAARGINPTLSYIFTTLGVAIVGIIFVVRRTLVLRLAASLATTPDDLISLDHWKIGYIATYALCEGLALLGLAQRFLGDSRQRSIPYYVGAFILLAFFRPQQPAREA
jgi:hypothetical protein